MKATMNWMFPGFTGKRDGVVIYFNSHLKRFIARKMVMPKYVPSGDFMVEVFAFRDRIEISDGFIRDCREYVKRYNSKNKSQDRAMNAWTNVFLKMMRAFVREYEAVELNSLSRIEIWEEDYPIKSVAEAIEAGYLDKVKGWESALCATI